MPSDKTSLSTIYPTDYCESELAALKNETNPPKYEIQLYTELISTLNNISCNTSSTNNTSNTNNIYNLVQREDQVVCVNWMVDIAAMTIFGYIVELQLLLMIFVGIKQKFKERADYNEITDPAPSNFNPSYSKYANTQ